MAHSSKIGSPARRLSLPIVEAVESRQLLSVTLLSSGVVQILGSNAADSIGVQESHHFITFADNGTDYVYATASVAAVHIQAYQGNDIIQVSNLRHPLNITDGNGNDEILSDATAKVSVGGGFDTVSFNFVSEGDTLNLGHDTIFAAGTLVGSSSGPENLIVGGSGNDTITTIEGYNTIFGGGGADSISCTAGHDLISGGVGNDTIVVQGRHSTLHGGQGNDSLQTQSDAGGFDVIGTGAGNDSVIAVDADTVFTGTGVDSITGAGAGNIRSGNPPA